MLFVFDMFWPTPLDLKAMMRTSFDVLALQWPVSSEELEGIRRYLLDSLK